MGPAEDTAREFCIEVSERWKNLISIRTRNKYGEEKEELKVAFGGSEIHFKADERLVFNKTLSSPWRVPQVSRSQGGKTLIMGEKINVLPSASDVGLSLQCSALVHLSLLSLWFLGRKQMQECKFGAGE